MSRRSPHVEVESLPAASDSGAPPVARDARSVADDTACYRALVSRDRRFDGKFFVAVRTTGIYCRPICPAPTPKARNVTFYACAAAAEANGFRPCLRCRPETAPGSSAWLGTSSTVVRAFRLIQAGALDGDDVEALAARLGIGSRHLRRLFVAHVGASPAAVAQTRRVQMAKRLLDETGFAIARIAHDAGFASVRRFNEAMLAAYGRPPSALRRNRRLDATVRAKHASGAGAFDGQLVLRLAYRKPFAWNSLLAFLSTRAIPGIEQVENDRYLRRVRVDDATGVVEVTNDATGACLHVALPAALSAGIASVLACVRRLFDLDADPIAIARVLEADALLQAGVRSHRGLRVPGAWDPFEVAVRAVIGQQISVAAATTLCSQLAAAFGERVADDAPCFVFPTPAVLAEAPLERLGVPRARARALSLLARCVDSGEIAFDGTQPTETVTAALQRLPGIGPWTAGYISMRALGEPDAFPYNDLGLRQALESACGKAVSAEALRARSMAWRPWRAYATLHLWLHRARQQRATGRRTTAKEATDAATAR